MILHLIGPDDHFTVNYWMEDEAPAVIYTQQRVWVRAANSTTTDHRYYEQKSARYIPDSFMTEVDK